MSEHIRKIEISSSAAARIEPQKEKQSEEAPPSQEISASVRWLILHLQILKRILQLLPKESDEDASLFMRKNLKKFARSLKELTEQDLSHDTAFLLQLSHHWNQFLEYFSPLSLTQNEEEKLLQTFLTSIHDYPANERYSLGFYLSEAAGEKWIPFPFMNLLHKLFEECQKEKQKSTLFHWIDLLEQYLEQF